MAKRVSADGWLFTVTLLLVFIGLIMVFSASAVMAKERYGSGYFFLFRQLVWAIAGITAMFIAMRVDYRRLKHPGFVFSLVGITTLLLILVFFLDRSHNTHRWIHWGAFSFQPSELAKPVLILFLAFFLEGRCKSMDDWRNTVLPAIIPTCMFLGLIVFQPDLGTAIACAAITVCILYVAGLQMKYLGYGLLASILPLYFLIFHVAYRRARILAFLNPYSDPQGKGFHIIQSLIAVSTGGITGTGLMEGKQKLFYLPEPHTDFYFFRHLRSAGRRGRHRSPVCDFPLAWRADRAAHSRYVWSLSVVGHHQHGGRAGMHQYQRGPRTHAHKRHSAAVHLVWRIVLISHAGFRWRIAEHYQAS